MQDNLLTAIRLHEFVEANQWTGTSLVGPDAGVRLNLRVGRFLKSYLNVLPWKDSYYYLQAQGYWTLANWRLYEATGDSRFSDIALRCSETMLATQRADGAWDYPNPEWRGRIATAEGSWASIGLIETFRRTRGERFLDGAVRWHRFLLNNVGFQRCGEELAVNYFSNVPRPRIPNNSAFAARFLAELADVTGDRGYVAPCPGLLAFLARAQTQAGELPYAVAEQSPHAVRPHYQCYQYNAFQCLDLLRYHELTTSATALTIARKVLGFLRGGVQADGRVRFDCHDNHCHIVYHAAAAGAAFATATALGVESNSEIAARCFGYVRRAQQSNGAFFFSQGDYYVLQDRRPYPRALAMILFHLLSPGGQTARTMPHLAFPLPSSGPVPDARISL